MIVNGLVILEPLADSNEALRRLDRERFIVYAVRSWRETLAAWLRGKP